MKKYTGLTQSQAKSLLSHHGQNIIVHTQESSFFSAFLHQFIDPMMLLLITAAGLIFFIGDPSDAYLIGGILLFNACVGTFQERKIHKLINTVQKQDTEYALVLRDNREIIIKATDIVPGDYLIMQQGEQVHADGSILHSENLSINEAVLTGEQYPVNKKDDDTIFKGTFVSTGIVHVCVSETGNKTRIGKLHKIAQETVSQTPLQKDLSGVIHIILGAVIGICGLLLLIGIITNRPFAELFAAIVALFICVVPQGLPVIMTLILASSAFSLLKRQFFVKKMSAVDGLARSQVIIFDKTGTLTTNELIVNRVITSTQVYNFSPSEKPLSSYDESFHTLTSAIALLEQHNLSLDTLIPVKGNATDVALCHFIKKCNVDIAQIYSSCAITTLPINIKDRSIVTRSCIRNNEKVLFMMGAPETIMAYCSISPTMLNHYTTLLQEGRRVIAVAQKVVKPSDTVVTDATLLGFIGITETIRDNAGSIIKKLQDAGITTIIATGDKKETALFVAKKTGIITDENLMYDGTLAIDNTTPDLLKKQLFYRMTPEKKIALIKYVQARGLSVAMIGDGFNDAPAVAAANTGIALGNRAADVTKQAASALLLDDGFEHLISIIGQGRHVFLSFKRVILYFFTTNFSEILIVIYSFCLQLPLPLLAPHILWLNLITDGFLDSSLALEPSNSHALEKNWFEKNIHLVDKFLVGRILYQSILVTSIAAYLFTTNYKTGLVQAQTLCLAAMTLCQCAMAINCRSFKKSLFSIGLFSNKTLGFIIVGIITGLIIITSTSWGNSTFKTTPLSGQEWLLLGSLALTLIVLEEIRKLIVYYISKK